MIFPNKKPDRFLKPVRFIPLFLVPTLQRGNAYRDAPASHLFLVPTRWRGNPFRTRRRPVFVYLRATPARGNEKKRKDGGQEKDLAHPTKKTHALKLLIISCPFYNSVCSDILPLNSRTHIAVTPATAVGMTKKLITGISMTRVTVLPKPNESIRFSANSLRWAEKL